MLGHDVDRYAERLRAFDWNALVIDGHDMEAIVEAYDRAISMRGRPTALVARTVKGKGVSIFESGENWHGKPLQKGEQLETAVNEVWRNVEKVENPSLTPTNTNRTSAPACQRLEPPSFAAGEQVATREAYGRALVKLGAANPLVVVLDADTKNSTHAEKFAAAYPQRYLEGFIAEQNMIGAAVGLSASGKIPFASTFACFLTRAFDQIRMAAVSGANLKLAGSHCGVSIGEDGPSQMGLEDVAMMRAVPGAVVLYPADAVATERLVEIMSSEKGIHYIRLTRPKTPILYSATDTFAVGGSKALRCSERDEVTVVGAGVTVFEALKAHDRLVSEGVHIRVIDAYSVKPIDRSALLEAARDTGGLVITVEDHYRDGGLGDAVLDALAAEKSVSVYKLAIEEVPRSGKPEQLLRAHGIDADAIATRVRQLVRSRAPAR
jgi:transketolase